MDNTNKVFISISLENGKYTFISYENDYRVHCLRYGKPWHIYEMGNRALDALMSEVEKMKTELDSRDEKINRLISGISNISANVFHGDHDHSPLSVDIVTKMLDELKKSEVSNDKAKKDDVVN